MSASANASFSLFVSFPTGPPISATTELRVTERPGIWKKTTRRYTDSPLEPRCLADFERACHHHQDVIESPFTQKVVTTRATPNGRVPLTPELCIVHENGKRSETPVNDEADWRRALESHFGIAQEPPS